MRYKDGSGTVSGTVIRGCNQENSGLEISWTRTYLSERASGLSETPYEADIC
jgi:hypothetical protein